MEKIGYIHNVVKKGRGSGFVTKTTPPMATTFAPTNLKNPCRHLGLPQGACVIFGEVFLRFASSHLAKTPFLAWQVLANERFACKIRNVVVTIKIVFGLNMQIVDTRFLVKRLISKKFTEEQAEEMVNIIKEIKEKDLDITATKRDIKELELRLKIHLGAMIFSLLLAFKILDKFL